MKFARRVGDASRMKSANVRSHDVAVLRTLMMMVVVVVRMKLVEVMRMML